MVAERKLKRTDVVWCLDRLNANCWIVDLYRRVCDAKMDRHVVFAAQPLIPHDQLECTVAALQEQVMNGLGLVHDREFELAGSGEGTFVRQNGRKVVKVDRGPTG